MGGVLSSAANNYREIIKSANIPALRDYLSTKVGPAAEDLISSVGLGMQESPLQFAASKLINELDVVFGDEHRKLNAAPFGKHVSQIIETFIMIYDHVKINAPDTVSKEIVIDFVNTLLDRKPTTHDELIRKFFTSLTAEGHYNKVDSGWLLNLPEFYLDENDCLGLVDDAHSSNQFILQEDGQVSIVHDDVLSEAHSMIEHSENLSAKDEVTLIAAQSQDDTQ
jgi:hypothetical protein